MKAYKVRIKSSGEEFLVSSLSAIYDYVVPSMVGCGLQHLWNMKVSQTGFFENKKMVIQSVEIHSKKKEKAE